MKIRKTRWTEEQIRWIDESCYDIINLVASRYRQIKYLQSLPVFKGRTFEAIRVKLKRKLNERRAELSIMKETAVEVSSIEIDRKGLHIGLTNGDLVTLISIDGEIKYDLIHADIDKLIKQRAKHRETVKNNRKGIRIR